MESAEAQCAKAESQNWRPILEVLGARLRGDERQRERTSIPPEQADQLALNAHAVGRKNANLVGSVGRLERN